MAQELYKAGKIKDLCEDADFFTRLTKLEAQYPNASVLVHKQGVLPAEVADLWSSPHLMSAARQFLGGEQPESEYTCQALHWCWGYRMYKCFCGDSHAKIHQDRLLHRSPSSKDIWYEVDGIRWLKSKWLQG